MFRFYRIFHQSKTLNWMKTIHFVHSGTNQEITGPQKDVVLPSLLKTLHFVNVIT